LTLDVTQSESGWVKDKQHFRLAEAISRTRRARDVSQKQLASACGIDPTRLSAIERGRVIAPGRAFVERVAQALGLDEADRVELAALEAHDRVMRQAVRVLPAAAHGLVAAALDAARLFAPEDARQLEVGIRSGVSARVQLNAFTGKEDAMT
jgi:transcriptional regulator with XRE-family HTH domain